jgi:hypothetical protein
MSIYKTANRYGAFVPTADHFKILRQKFPTKFKNKVSTLDTTLFLIVCELVPVAIDFSLVSLLSTMTNFSLTAKPQFLKRMNKLPLFFLAIKHKKIKNLQWRNYTLMFSNL